MKIVGSGKSETLHGTNDDDLIRGHGGDDIIIAPLDQGGTFAPDRIYGGAGDDVIRGGTFDISEMADLPAHLTEVDGGSGSDTFTLTFTNMTGQTEPISLQVFQKNVKNVEYREL